MAQLLPPVVALPVSQCSKTIRLLGLVPGTTVRIFSNLRLIATGTAESPDQTFDVTGLINAGESIQAKQDFSTEGSDFSPDEVTALHSPASQSDLRPLGLVSHLYECGQQIWLDGAFPGATVTVTSGGTFRGNGVSPDGNVHIALNGKIAPGEILSVQQIACGITSALQALPAPDKLPIDDMRKLPPPLVEEPLFGCQQRIAVSEVFDGATVFIHREDGDEFATVDSSSSGINLVRALKFKENVSASQSFAGCEIRSNRLAPPVLVAFDELPAPFLNEPICNRDRSVNVSGLIPGALVMFMSSGNDFAYGTAWSSECTFSVPDLFSTQKLSVKQGLCTPLRWSDQSNIVEVDQVPAQGDLNLTLATPLFQCGRKVHVTGCTPGVKILLHSKFWGGQIGWTYAKDFECDIDALLPLRAGIKELWVSAMLCGDLQKSPEEDVLEVPVELNPPVVADPLHDCGGSIRVVEVIPGAAVEVYVNDQFAGCTRTSFKEANVPVRKMLARQDKVKARQSICASTTRFGDEKEYVEGDDIKAVPWASGIFSDRISQLTGKKDSVPGHGHLTDTSSCGVFGTDLGINFEHGGRLYIYFGDEGIDDSDEATRDADPIFYTNDLKVFPGGIHIHPVLQANSNLFRRLAVNGQSDLGNFEVPTGGFSFSGKHYVFIARRNPREMQRSLLASAANPVNGFDFLYWIDETGGDNANNMASLKFINVSPTVIRNLDWVPHLSASGSGLLMFGSGHYRESGIFLAWAPLTPGSDPPAPDQWRYYNSQIQTWSDPGVKAAATPLSGSDNSGSAPHPDQPFKVGELSVSWVPQMRRWVMLYGRQDDDGNPVIRCHYARHPTGPWHLVKPDIFLPTRDRAFSVYMHQDGRDDGLADRSGISGGGASYGSYLVPRYTLWNPWTRTAILHYLVSTHIPYQVMLMKFRLQCV